MKIQILPIPDRKVVSIFITSEYNGKPFYLKISKQGWLQLESLKTLQHIPAFVEIPNNIAKEFLSELTLALGRIGYFAKPRKKTIIEKLLGK